MSDLKNQLQAIYEQNFIGQKLTKIDIQMISDNYLEYEEGKVWITEGGVELTTEEKTISMTYESADDEIKFIAVESPLLPYVDQYDYYSIELESEDYYSLIDTSITNLDIHWVKIIETDYKGEILNEEEFAAGFTLAFENGSTLQIASVETTMSSESMTFSKINYALEGTILVAFNHIFEIEGQSI